jgi:hypothetical protein
VTVGEIVAEINFVTGNVSQLFHIQLLQPHTY